MKNKAVTFFLIGMALLIAGVIAVEYLSNHPGRQKANPYAYDMASQTEVPEEMILYRESRNFKLNLENPAALSYADGRLVAAGDRRIVAIDLSGEILHEFTVPIDPVCIKASGDRYFVGGGDQILALDTAGSLVSTFSGLSENSVITSIDVAGEKVFAADAGKRVVYRFTKEGVKETEFEGKSGDDSNHGFIVPSPCFDLLVNPFCELWIVNPGKHALENYTFDGVLRGFWTSSFSGVKGFSGCCNPAQIASLPDGNFVTAEKGVVRIKEYKASGELVGVVAAPVKFTEDQKAPDLVCDEEGRVYVLDPFKKMIRVFEKK